MYHTAQQYRILLHQEVTQAMKIVPHDMAFKTNLYKAICSIPHDLTVDVAARIRQEIFKQLNKTL